MTPIDGDEIHTAQTVPGRLDTRTRVENTTVRVENCPVRPSLSVLDLVPITSGSTASDALHCSVDLARRTERAGYRRYWIAEHHLNPGVAGTAPAVVMSLIANATSTIRVGSGAVQMGHHTPLSVVEQFGLLDAAYPGRIDLGLGRSGFRRGARTPFTGGGSRSRTKWATS